MVPQPSRSYRDLRRALVVASAVAVIVLAACAPAWAGEPAPAVLAEVPDTTALARIAIAESRLDDALRVLARAETAASSDDERAAAQEMSRVVERWVALRKVVFPRARGTPRGEREAAGEGSTEPSTGTDWETGFAIAHAQLVAGDFDLAAPSFASLQVAAKNGRQASRARALGSLARELATKDLVLGWTEPGARIADRAPDWHRDPRGTKKRWYGWQTLMADGASLLVVPVVGGVILPKGEHDDAIALAAVGGYALAPGAIHLAHGRPGAAAASVGLRVGMPITGGLLGLAVSKGNCHTELCGLDGAVLGFALGAVGAIAIDAAALSRETVEEEDGKPTSASASRPKAITLTPSGGPRKEGGFDVGVAAVF